MKEDWDMKSDIQLVVNDDLNMILHPHQHIIKITFLGEGNQMLNVPRYMHVISDYWFVVKQDCIMLQQKGDYVIMYNGHILLELEQKKGVTLDYGEAVALMN